MKASDTDPDTRQLTPDTHPPSGIIPQMAAVSLTTVAMGLADMDECWRLDQRCFADGEAYDRETFRELLAHRDAIALKTVAADSVMVGFVIGLVEPDGTDRKSTRLNSSHRT